MASAVCAAAPVAEAQESFPPGSSATNSSNLFARGPAPAAPARASGLEQTNTPGSGSRGQTWNWHVQNPAIVQGDFGFPAKYSGPASLNNGALTYAPERVQETCYNLKIGETIHATMDYQFITDPAFNQDRGPVSVFGARLHWEF